MKIGLFGKRYDSQMHTSLQALVHSLEKHGVEIFVFDDFYSLIKDGITFTHPPKVFSNNQIPASEIDFLFSIGGDGTLLKTVALLGHANIPIVGVNMGHLGFLTTISGSDVDSYVSELIGGNYTIEQRSMLHVEYGTDTEKTERFVLNEVNLHRDKPLTLLSIDVFVDGDFLATYSGDGLIAATPTGSTAYSLSCGGPILTPNSNCFVLTPIAVHTLTFRPIIVPDTAHIRIVTASKTDTMCLGLDSDSIIVPVQTEINIRKENFGIQLVRMDKQNFYSALRDKLMWGIDKRL
ncbi:MAG: NAD kinase [Bacteroidales bacterium]|nr:NAD kinase [Bacteroidales bacterium]